MLRYTRLFIDQCRPRSGVVTRVGFAARILPQKSTFRVATKHRSRDDARVLSGGDYEILSSRRSREQRGTRHGVSCFYGRAERSERVRRSRDARTCPCVHQPSVIQRTDRLLSVHHLHRQTRAHHEASYLFTLTQYLLGRIGEAVVRSRRQPISGTVPHSERPASRSFHGTHPLSFGIKIQSPVRRLIFSRLSRVIGF